MIKAELTVDQLNLNPYLPPQEESAAAGGEGGGAAGEAGGGADAGGEWSDEPIDVSALGALNADLAFNAGGIQFRDVKIGKSSLAVRSEEHTSELQSLMRISYAVFCLKNKTR